MDRYQNVLKWLKSEKALSVFVQNRVKKINSHRDITFHYITSKDNLADIATRGSDMHSCHAISYGIKA